MSAELEGVFYFGVMVLAIILTGGFAYWWKQKGLLYGKTMHVTTALSFGLFGAACIWWGFFASDGFSQVIGWALYGIVFVGTNLIVAVLLYFVMKRRAAL